MLATISKVTAGSRARMHVPLPACSLRGSSRWCLQPSCGRVHSVFKAYRPRKYYRCILSRSTGSGASSDGLDPQGSLGSEVDELGDGEEGVPEESLDLDEEEIEEILENDYVSESDDEAVARSRRVPRPFDLDAEFSELDSLIEAVKATPSRQPAAQPSLPGGGPADVAPGASAAVAAAVAAAPSLGASTEAAPPDEEVVPREYPPRPSRSRQLADLLRAAGYAEAAELAPGGVEVTDVVTCNSAEAEPGALYVCVPSTDTQEDGHFFVQEAAELGVAAVVACAKIDAPPPGLLIIYVKDSLEALGKLADAFYDRPSRRLRTVGVVGSYGKTTSAWLMRGMFEASEELTGMIGTIEYALGVDRLTPAGDIWEPEGEDVTEERECSTPFHITPYENKYGCPTTTPDALHLHKTLAGMADRGADTAILECHTTAMQDGRCDDVDVDVAVFTNLYPEACEEVAFQDLVDGMEEGERLPLEVQQAVRAEQGRAHSQAVQSMFDRLTDQNRQRAVVNIDDRLGQELVRSVTARDIPTVTYAIDDRDADVFAERMKLTIWEVEVLVRTPLGRLQIILPLLGRHNVYNILAAVSVGIACGVPLPSIVAGIEAVDIIPGRSEVIDEGQPFSVVVDYARTPQQLARLLDDVHEAGTKKTWLVMGCPGTTSRDHRRAMAAVAHEKSEAVFFTNDSPGTSFPDEIIADMTSGLPDDVLSKFSGSVYNNFQDMHRVPHWYQVWLMNHQSYFQRYVVEDRFSAIRVAIGMAKKGDVVLVTGRGHLDFMEYWDGEAEKVEDPDRGVELEMDGTVVGWFDDRVECRNALSKLPYLEDLKDLNRDYLPWTRWIDEDRSTLAVHQMMRFEYGEGEGVGLSLSDDDKEVEVLKRAEFEEEDDEDDIIEEEDE